jgi:hypothetical protein
MFGNFTFNFSTEYLQMTRAGKFLLRYGATYLKPRGLTRRQAERWFKEHYPKHSSWKDAIREAQEWQKEKDTK